MVPIRLADQVTLTPTRRQLGRTRRNSTRCSYRLAGSLAASPSQVVPTGTDNLIVKSLELLQERSGCPLGARVELVKANSNGGRTWRRIERCGCCVATGKRRWRIHWSDERLAEVAAELGSDIPFFLVSWRRNLPRSGRAGRAAAAAAVALFRDSKADRTASVLAKSIALMIRCPNKSPGCPRAIESARGKFVPWRMARRGHVDAQPLAGRGERAFALRRKTAPGFR